MFGIDIFVAMLHKKTPKVQRGVAASAGNIAISAVNPARAVVFSKSKGSAGYVAARGSISLNPSGGSIVGMGGNSEFTAGGSFPSYSGSISGGTTDLTVKEFSAKLVNATTLSCDGPVEWQVIEYF